MKNLFDISKQIKNTMDFINKNDEHITSVEINQKTLDYLKTENIYGFSDTFNKVIPVIINNYINDNEIKFNREKNNKVTEYEPYKELGDDK